MLLFAVSCSTTEQISAPLLEFEPDAELIAAVPQCSLNSRSPAVAAFCLHEFALIEQRAGNTEKAIDLFRQVLEIDAERADVYESLGDIYLGEEDLQQARAAYRSAIEIGTSSPKSYNNVGAIHDRLGDLDTAIADYQQAIQLDPDNARIHYNLGSAYVRNGEQFELAIAEFRRAVELDPSLASAYYDLGQIYEHLGEDLLADAAYHSAANLGHEPAIEKLR